MAESTHRHILRATTLVGGATLGALIIALARNKTIALLDGPTAIGLLGLFTSIVAMASSVAMFGLNTSVVRQLSPQVDHPAEAARIRRSMWTLALPLALMGGAAVWLAREPLSIFTTDSVVNAAAVGLLSFGVIFAVIGELQLAVLQSYGRLADVARVKLWGALAAMLFSVAAVALLGTSGIVLAVLAVPFAAAVTALWFGRGLPPAFWRNLRKERVSDRWPAMLAIGTLMMLTGAVGSAHQLAVRALISQQMGLYDVGLFQAANAIMVVNVSLVLNAMAADYYPRLAKAEGASETAQLLNIQVHSTLMMVAPILTATCVAAPLALALLYSSEFTEGASLLRLLCASAVLRIPIWALGFVLLTRGAGLPYLIGEIVSVSVVPLAWLLLPSAGLAGAGWAAVIANVLSLAYYGWQVRRAHAVRMEAAIIGRVTVIFLFLLAVAVSFSFHQVAGLAIGSVGALLIGWDTYLYLRRILGPEPQN